MIRALYSLAMWLVQPLLRARLRKRALAEPGYAFNVDERFGHYSMPAARAPGFIWIHAVSLGETRAAAILIARLRDLLPGMRLLLTHGTATGRAAGAVLLQADDVQVWQPWDRPGAVRSFLAHFKPRIGILMETEVWPNLSASCRAMQVPLVLANARMSEKSLKQSLQLAWLARPAYRSLAAVWAQTAADADRLRQLGARVSGVLGNLKFDASPHSGQLAQGHAWRAALLRPVVLFASSREGEEAQLLDILSENRSTVHKESASVAPLNVANRSFSGVQWLIVPRHPQRFDEVSALVASYGFGVSRRSAWGNAMPPAHEAAAGSIWVGDSLGEMSLYYAFADVALLGGSFAPLGGQNLIEAAACNCPVVMGPHTFNFAEAAELAEAAGAALRVPDLAHGVVAALAWVADAGRLEAGHAAAAGFTRAHQGATDKLAQAIHNQLLPPA